MRYDAFMSYSHAGDSRLAPRVQRLVTSGRDSLARIWDVRQGTQVLELFGHEGGVLFATFSPDDSLVVTVGEDGTRVWDAATGKMISRFLGAGDPAVAFVTADGASLVTGGVNADSSVRIHTFGASGPVERLTRVANTRVTDEAASRAPDAR